MEYEKVIEAVKKVIHDKGMKQCVVAERAGFSESEFSNMLNAHGNPLIANRMHMEFAKEMRGFHLKHEKQDVEENVENMAKAIAHILSNLKEER